MNMQSVFTTKNGKETHIQAGDLMIYDRLRETVSFERPGNTLKLNGHDETLIPFEFENEEQEIEIVSNMASVMAACTKLSFRTLGPTFHAIAIEFF